MFIYKGCSVIAVLSAFQIAGCADGPSDDAGDDTADVQEPAAQVASAPKVTITKVTPVGDGCGPTSYDVKISPDGTRFDVTYREYKVRVAPDVTNVTDAKSCSLAVTLKTPTGYSSAVTGVQFNGTGMLESGVTGTQTVRYRWNGASPADRTLTQTLRGPIAEGTYKYDLPVVTNDRVFTACGTERQLILDTTMMLRNGQPKRTGWLNATTVIGVAQTNRVDPSLSVSLLPRPCIE